VVEIVPKIIDAINVFHDISIDILSSLIIEGRLPLQHSSCWLVVEVLLLAFRAEWFDAASQIVESFRVVSQTLRLFEFLWVYQSLEDVDVLWLLPAQEAVWQSSGLMVAGLGLVESSNHNSAERSEMQSWTFELGVESVIAILAFGDG
jgi:hypothetical protein